MSYAVKGAPFRYRGAVNVEECKTAADVMSAAGLDWEVAKCELVAKMPIHTDKPENGSFVFGSNNYVDCPNAYATYRTDYNIPLGIVKERYTPVQNIDAFTFFDGAIGKDKAIWQTAGFFGSGERIFVSAKLPKNILVDGDPVENYLVFTTSHDGSSGVKILFTPIRVVCQNTLTAAIRTSTNYISIRHTESAHANIKQAHEVLGITKKKIEYANEVYNMLANIKVTDEIVMEYICKHNLSEAEIEKLLGTNHTFKQIIYRNGSAVEDAEISTRKLNIITDTWEYYNDGIGQKEIAGTAWGAFNAISGYYSNVDNSEGSKRMDSLLFNDKAKKLEKAINYEFV